MRETNAPAAIGAQAETGTRVALPYPTTSAAFLSFVLASIVGLLQVWGTIGPGYFAGWGDHFVLSPEGLSWAHPGAFENDWFMEVAPQPHWFFDLWTFAGESFGILTQFYVVFWVAGLLAFGVATSMLAYKFFPLTAWPIGIGVASLSGVMPWMIGGTGSGMIPQALPAVLSANLIYLLIAGLLTEKRVLVVVLAPVIAVVHVQQGSIAIVLLAAMLVVEGSRDRKIDWYLGGALGLTVAVVAFGLFTRPVASNLQDFVQICDQVIPYHCASHLWGRYEHLSTIGLIILTSLSVVVVPRRKRWIWYSTVGLATLGYAGGYLSDALQIPILGTLAQGVNVYRLGAVLVPFVVWGAFAPMLVRLRGFHLLLLLGGWGIGWVAFLTAPGFTTNPTARVVLLGAALLIPLVWYTVRIARDPNPAARSASAVFTAGMLVLVVSGVLGALVLRAPNVAFIGDANLRAWGAEVRDVVPQGEVLVSSPRHEWVKLITQRAVIADCKDVPYGGEAWDEWQRRIDILGGVDQCIAPGPLLYDKLSARELVAVADRFDSDYIVVNAELSETLEQLEVLGWARVVGPVSGAGAELFQRPS